MQPKFSVVIPTYNHGHFLSDALMSVLQQTCQDFEIIVVNNHSTDNTLDVIQRFDDSRINVINYHNYGVIGAARNVGIQASKSDYIAFLDSDDKWYPTKLERVEGVIAINPSVGLICHNQDLFRENIFAGTARYGPVSGYKGSIHDYLLFKGNCVSTSATVVNRALLLSVGNFSEDINLITVEDYDLWLRLAKVSKFYFIKDTLGVHNYHSLGASANVRIHLKATLFVIDKHFAFETCRTNLKCAYALRAQRSKAYYGAGRQSQRLGKYGTSAINYLFSLLCNPFQIRIIFGILLLFLDIVIGGSRRRNLMRKMFSAFRSTHWTLY